MPGMTKKAATLGYLDEFVQDQRRAKEASLGKRAEPLSEPGGYQGKTTHPSKDVDDHTIEAREGSRSSENTSDAKNNREAPSVDATGEASVASNASQEDRQLNIGTKQRATGEDPASEDDFKSDKEDPGTTSVMKADDGEKYGAYRAMPLHKVASEVNKLSHVLLSQLATGQATTTNVVNPPAANNADLSKAAQAGYNAASAAQVSVDQAHEFVADIVKSASISADLVIDRLYKFAGGDDASAGEDHSGKGDDAGGAGPDGGAGGGAPPMAPPGGDPGGGGPPPGMGGPPPGGDPMAGAAAGDPGAPLGPQDQVSELAAAFQEMNLDPETLIQVAQVMASQGGGAPGGPPPPGGDPMGGPPPGAGGPPPPGGDPTKMAQCRTMIKAAKAVINLRNSGEWGLTHPATPKHAALRATYRKELREFIGA